VVGDGLSDGFLVRAA